MRHARSTKPTVRCKTCVPRLAHTLLVAGFGPACRSSDGPDYFPTSVALISSMVDSKDVARCTNEVPEPRFDLGASDSAVSYECGGTPATAASPNFTRDRGGHNFLEAKGAKLWGGQAANLPHPGSRTPTSSSRCSPAAGTTQQP